jgi:hypothetical protein
MDTSNLYVTIWNIDRESSHYTYENILTIANYDSTTISPAEQESVPKWIKNNASWWSNGAIGDTEFLSGIQYLIDNGAIIIPISNNVNDVMSENTYSSIPSWIKNNAKWWSEDKISDTDFISGMQYLIKTGSLKV